MVFDDPTSRTPTGVFPLGATEVTLTASDQYGHRATATQSVMVRDTTKPVIALVGANPQVLECRISPYVELGATALDLGDGNLTGSIVVDASAVDMSTPGFYTVAYNVLDAAGNAAVVTRTVKVVDTTPPVITLNGDAAMRVVYQSTYMETATATDLVDGPVAVTANVTVNTGAVGLYTLIYTATDASGNTGTATRTVEVYKTPVQLTGDLVAKIDGDINIGAIPAGNGNAFKASLKAAIASLNAGQTSDAISELKAFINKVKAQSGKKISVALANQLIASAQQIIGQLGGVAKLVSAELPTRFALGANYPNPFNPATTLHYDLAGAGQVRLIVYNVMGQQIRVLVDQPQEAGRYQVEWDATDASGQRVAPGLYLYRLVAGDQAAVGKMLLLK